MKRAAMTSVIAALVLMTAAGAARAADPVNAVDFVRDVAPILKNHCAECHAADKAKGGLSINTRSLVLAGGETAPAVVPGKPDESELYKLVTQADVDERMPPAKKKPLTPEQIATLKRWIETGASWPEEFTFGTKFRKAPLEPRDVELPGDDAAGHPLDRLIGAYFAERGVKVGEVVDDRTFARRAHLDLTGLLPTPAQLAAFEADTAGDKRAKLVDALLADDRAYAEHWMTFWNDALRNAYRGTGFIDDGRAQITGWLFGSLYANKRYDRFVWELVTASPGAEGFVKGIKWRGTVNDSQRREMQAAQTISQVFMGTNLKCASCHDSFVNDWKLADAYALASVFADKPLELHRCDKPIGQTSSVGFLYPQLGAIDASAPVAERMRQLGDMMVRPENGRLTRTIVNRLWASLMGRGIVEPLDDMDAEPWSADVLDWLAGDLAANRYDLKRTLRMICTSRAYQLASDSTQDAKEDYVFAGPHVKRMSAEQFVDALAMVNGHWAKATGEMQRMDGRKQGGQLAAVLGAVGVQPSEAAEGGKWVWSHAEAGRVDAGGRIYLRKRVTLTDRPTAAPAAVTCDNQFVLYVNGHRVAAGEAWDQPARVNMAEHLVKGENVIAVEATNWPDRVNHVGEGHNAANPAGLRFFAVVKADGGGKRVTIASDASWKWAPDGDAATRPAEGWTLAAYDDAKWQAVAELTGGLPWNPANFKVALGGDGAAESDGEMRIRSVLAMTDDLTGALGRPNREQVVTRRDSAATTLQALELTNGATLDAMLNAGAERWLARHGDDVAKLVDALYAQALGRQPTLAEAGVALELIGPQPSRDGVADLMWAIFMLPEFQLIR